MANNNTALQVTNFDFYGDELIALKIMQLAKSILLLHTFLEELGLQKNKLNINVRRLLMMKF